MLDNIWIFVVIIGAVISIAQKNQQRQRNVGPNDAPTLDPQAELERRMREIFGDITLSESETADVTPTTTVQQVEQMERPVNPQQAQAATTTMRANTYSSTIQKPNYTTKPSFSSVSAQNSTKVAINKANKTMQSDPIKDGDITAQNSEINKIIDDFTMEKAVIYSEILRPKFEE